MTIPIGIAVIEELKKVQDDKQKTGIDNESYDDFDEADKETDFDTIDFEEKQTKSSLNLKNFGKAILLTIPYSCTVGGSASLTGTNSNLVLSDYWADQFPDSPISLSYTEWMGFGIVNSICFLFVMIIYLNVFFFGFRCESNKEEEQAVSEMIARKYEQLGKISPEEILVLITFVIVIIMWFFREPGFMNGWTVLFPEPGFISDGVPAVFFGVLLFLIPAEKSGFWKCPQEGPPARAIHSWKRFNEKMPWDILLLIGAGFAMADGADASGFSTWVAKILANLVGGLENSLHGNLLKHGGGVIICSDFGSVGEGVVLASVEFVDARDIGLFLVFYAPSFDADKCDCF
ncbi:Oidioi.mRNA.OKI2018_I69.chr2.g5251.t1.cds [Oikopleura dioica]|uniref:Oidioi.mRNA.OKI2018_I69.chr2.g5251.t1.cds n=1 Tax=Oikopleura dioica TaxID=34765 RepID=A0ABN7T6D6_OIKDI|nr:Oidioi.mRNA.OKI2018_I69.chr2.g5251.t1.cds [Oikopleura dioica]